MYPGLTVLAGYDEVEEGLRASVCAGCAEAGLEPGADPASWRWRSRVTLSADALATGGGGGDMYPESGSIDALDTLCLAAYRGSSCSDGALGCALAALDLPCCALPMRRRRFAVSELT